MSHEMRENDTCLSGSNIVPWHRHPGSTTIKGRATASEVLKLAGLDWEVKKVPLMLADGSGRVLDDAMATQRADDGTILGVVGEKYEVIQNRDSLQVFQAVSEVGDAIFETAGSLFGGSKIYVSALIDGLIEVGKDDITKKYLLFMSSHDGSSAATVRLSSVRVICANTMQMALRENGRHVAIRHTNNANDNLRLATEMLGLANQRFKDMEESYNEMLKVQVSESEMKSYLERCFKKAMPKPTDKQDKAQGEDIVGVNKEKVVRAIPQILELYETGHHLPQDAGTLYRLFQSVTEFSNHKRQSRSFEKSMNTKEDNALNSILFGQSANLNEIAYKEAVKLLKA